MSDLVARLLNAPADGLGTDALCVYAADRITALEAQLAEARNAALEEAAGVLMSAIAESKAEAIRRGTYPMLTEAHVDAIRAMKGE